MDRTASITRLLERARGGDQAAYDELLPLIHGELHGLARRQMADQKPGHTLQATALLNEAWVKISGQGGAPFEGRGHFLRVAASAMRSILVDHARAKRTRKRGEGRKVENLPDDLLAPEVDQDLVLAVGEAVERLARFYPSLALVVEMRLFAGLTHAEIAESLGVTTRTIERDWRAAREWLGNKL